MVVRGWAMSKEARGAANERMNATVVDIERAAEPLAEAAIRPAQRAVEHVQPTGPDLIGRVERGVPHDDPWLIETRDRFFPGWWTYAGDFTPSDTRPLYRVVCANDEDRRAAEEAKPDFIDAIILVDEGVRAPMSAHGDDDVREAAARRWAEGGELTHYAALRRWQEAGLLTPVQRSAGVLVRRGTELRRLGRGDPRVSS
jgi:hypothetical protein